MDFIKKYNISTLFLFIAIPIGLIYYFFVPPLNSMDEVAHFYKIYHIADGHWNGEMNDAKTTLGGTIPRSLVTVAQPFQKIYDSGTDLVNKDTFTAYFNYPLNADDKIFVSFPNTARYAPSAYLPQVTAVWLMKMINASPLLMTYAARMAAFITWLFLVFWALKIAPLSIQRILFLLAVLPASLSLNNTMNADVCTNGLIFLSIALMMKWRQQDDQNGIKISEKIILFVSFILICINKICYFPLITVLFMVPYVQFSSLFKKAIYMSALSIAGLIVILIWVKHVNELVYPFPNDITHTTYNFLNKDAALVNPELQIQYIKSHLSEFIPTFLYRTSLPMYRLHCFNFLGSFSTGNNLPSTLGYIAWAIMIAYLMSLKTNFQRWERWGMFAMAHCMSLIFILSQYLHWDSVGGEISNGHLSKYFIPMYPFFAFALSGLKFDYFKDKKWLLNLLFLIFIVMHIDMFVILMQRYYF